jgi:hypothetical protein
MTNLCFVCSLKASFLNPGATVRCESLEITYKYVRMSMLVFFRGQGLELLPNSQAKPPPRRGFKRCTKES